MYRFSEDNNITELVFIIDRSGSMEGFESDTIGGFNSMIKRQRMTDGEVLVTTILFNNNIDMLHDRIPIEEISPMSEMDYQVMGCTALLDAIGGTIKHISSIHKYSRKSDVPKHTIFVITTDGMENASRSFTSKEVKKMITEKTEKNGWEFIFLGANIDSVETARNIGIRKERAANYEQSREGYAACYEAMSAFVDMVRGDTADFDDQEWKRKLDFDKH